MVVLCYKVQGEQCQIHIQIFGRKVYFIVYIGYKYMKKFFFFFWKEIHEKVLDQNTFFFRDKYMKKFGQYAYTFS